MSQKLDTRILNELCQAFCSLRDQREIRDFLTDLCTPGELSALSDRWRVARLVDRGVPYRSIYEKTGVSTATITRVARSIELGEGGYRIALDRSTSVEG